MSWWELPDDHPISQQMRAQKAAHEHMHMEVDSNTHQLWKLLERICEDYEDGMLLGAMIMNIARSEDPRTLATWYQAQMITMINMKHKRCLACGVDHDAELAEIQGGTPHAPPPTH